MKIQGVLQVLHSLAGDGARPPLGRRDRALSSEIGIASPRLRRDAAVDRRPRTPLDVAEAFGSNPGPPFPLHCRFSDEPASCRLSSGMQPLARRSAPGTAPAVAKTPDRTAARQMSDTGKDRTLVTATILFAEGDHLNQGCTVLPGFCVKPAAMVEKQAPRGSDFSGKDVVRKAKWFEYDSSKSAHAASVDMHTRTLTTAQTHSIHSHT